MQLYRMAFDEAVEYGGMGMNIVAKTYFLFNKLGISKAEREELLLKVNGDMSQFEMICGIITSLASDEEGQTYESTTTRMSTQFYTGDYEYHADWQYYECEDEGVYWQDDAWYEDDVWHDAAEWSETNWADTDRWWQSDDT